MSREIVDGEKKVKTTIDTSKLLMDTIASHVRKNGDSQTGFINRALVNQLEREGNFEIRSMIKEDL